MILGKKRPPFRREQKINKILGGLPVFGKGRNGDGDIANPRNLGLIQGHGLDPLRVPVLEDPPTDDRIRLLQGDGGGGFFTTAGIVDEVFPQGFLLG
ncbi:MAG: hypothetical protein QXK34_01515, partial [Candidatus Bathyarchaeia archaeon]